MNKYFSFYKIKLSMISEIAKSLRKHLISGMAGIIQVINEMYANRQTIKQSFKNQFIIQNSRSQMKLLQLTSKCIYILFLFILKSISSTVFAYPRIYLLQPQETIMNSTHPTPNSQSCGPTVCIFPSLVISNLVDLNHEEINNVGCHQSDETNFSFFKILSLFFYIWKQKPIFPTAGLFVYLEPSPQMLQVVRFQLGVQNMLKIKRTIEY